MNKKQILSTLTTASLDADLREIDLRLLMIFCRAKIEKSLTETFNGKLWLMQQMLAENIGVSKSAVSLSLKKLCELDYLKRERASFDKRIWLYDIGVFYKENAR